MEYKLSSLYSMVLIAHLNDCFMLSTVLGMAWFGHTDFMCLVHIKDIYVTVSCQKHLCGCFISLGMHILKTSSLEISQHAYRVGLLS